MRRRTRGEEGRMNVSADLLLEVMVEFQKEQIRPGRTMNEVVAVALMWGITIGWLAHESEE